MSTTVVASLLGYIEEVNEQYYTYDITEMKEKQVMVGMATKEIQNTHMQKDEMDLGKKVIIGD